MRWATVAAVRTIPEQVAVDRDTCPADPGRDGLYTPDELYDAVPYADSLDARAYRWSLRTQSAGAVLSRVKVVDPSWFNWPALPLTVTDAIVPDFPLINKSFNLSYAGNDL